MTGSRILTKPGVTESERQSAYRTSRQQPKAVEVTTRSNLPDWQTLAACSDLDPMVFFPPEATSDFLAGRQKKTDPELEGLTICHACPVEQECGEWAIEQKLGYGIYGGMLPGTRRTKAKRRGRSSEF